MKKKILLLGLLLCLLSVVSCGNEETMDKSRIYNIYVMNKDETKLSANEYAAVGESREEIIEELLYQLTATPERMEYKAPLSGPINCSTTSRSIEIFVLYLLYSSVRFVSISLSPCALAKYRRIFTLSLEFILNYVMT